MGEVVWAGQVLLALSPHPHTSSTPRITWLLLHLSAPSRLGCGPTGGTKAQTTSPNAHQTHPRSPGAQLGHEFNQFRPTGGSYAAALLGLPNPILTATRGTPPPPSPLGPQVERQARTQHRRKPYQPRAISSCRLSKGRCFLQLRKRRRNGARRREVRQCCSHF